MIGQCVEGSLKTLTLFLLFPCIHMLNLMNFEDIAVNICLMQTTASYLPAALVPSYSSKDDVLISLPIGANTSYIYA